MSLTKRKKKKSKIPFQLWKPHSLLQASLPNILEYLPSIFPQIRDIEIECSVGSALHTCVYNFGFVFTAVHTTVKLIPWHTSVQENTCCFWRRLLLLFSLRPLLIPLALEKITYDIFGAGEISWQAVSLKRILGIATSFYRRFYQTNLSSF